MTGFKTIIGIVAFILLSGYGSPVFAQETQEFLSNLKPGDWVDIEGASQEDFTILLEEIKVIYGEMEDDDWEISGLVSGVVPEENKVFILLVPIRLDNDTQYKYKKNDEEGIKSFSDIKPGVYAEAEGSFLEDSTFLAKEFAKENPKKGRKNMIEWKGKVQSVDMAKNSFTILGHTVILTPETIIKSLIHK